MPPSTLHLNKRFLSLLLTTLCLLTLLSLLFSYNPSTLVTNSSIPPPSSSSSGNLPTKLDHSTLHGGVISSKIGNETIKAELGRAAWRLLHTTMAKFPDKPTEDEQTALLSYILLFARLYPCGECASHFQTILSKFPPQVRTRSTAAAWACHVHNEVNRSLGKADFDCSKIGDFYDCGCAEDDEDGKSETETKAKLQAGDEVDVEKETKSVRVGKEKEGKINLDVQRNGPTQGG